jgi:poly(3-hydroxybutyrate) depolymerase
MRFGGRTAIAGLAIVMAAAGAAACSPVARTDSTLTVDHQQVTLHYTASKTARPLVVALHGLNSNGADFAKITGLSQYADANNFVVAYPDAHPTPPVPDSSPTPTASTGKPPVAPYGGSPSGAGLNFLRSELASGVIEDGKMLSTVASSERAWNAGTCCGGATSDDVAYLRDVVKAVELRTPIDPRRVYVIGLSNGGMMALKAVCEAPDIFAAAGSVAGPYLGTSCKRPVWIHLHDARDPIVPYYGGHPPGSPFLRVASDWCACSFPNSSTEAQRFSTRTVSVQMAVSGVHSWPRVGDGAWNFDGSRNLWAFVSRLHL